MGTRSPCFPEMRVCVLVFYVAPGRSTRETEPPREGRTWRRSPRPLECRLNLEVWPDRQGSWDFKSPTPISTWPRAHLEDEEPLLSAWAGQAAPVQAFQSHASLGEKNHGHVGELGDLASRL